MAAYNTYTDQELIVLLKEGDQQAFTVLYKHYWPLLYLHVYKMTEDVDMAEDVVQEVFAWLWQHAPEMDVSVSLSPYLYSAVRNRVFKLIRHEKVKANHLEGIAAFLEEGHFQMEEEMRYKELVDEIESEISKMPPKMREVFNLSRKEQLSHKEIAALLNVSESTVREQVKRALKLLRLRLKDRPHLLYIMLHLIG